MRADPFGQDLNLYAYVFGNPVTWIDPFGYCGIKRFFTLEGQADFWAGFGDLLTSGFGLTYLFGVPSLTEWIRSQWNEQFWGGEDYINYDSFLYSAGAFTGDIVGGTIVGAGIVKLGGRVLKGVKGLRAPKRPNQLHHFATNKGKAYTPRLKKIAEQHGLDLDDVWNKELMPHQGRHPNAYHDFVTRGMERAAREAGKDKGKFLELFDKYIKEPVRQNPDLLRKSGWE